MNPSNHEHESYGDAIEPIAIVGTACRFPGGATTMEKLWSILHNKRCVVSDVPTQRFDVDGWYHPDPNRKGSVNMKKGFFLQEDISLFDAAFFAITAKEAAAMDPMCRLLLEVAYEAFENAGHSIESLSGSSTAVFTGCMTDDYEMLSTHDTLNLGQNAASGVSRSMLSNRLSWFFDLRGPSLTLDTACSSSLYALHLACQSLRLGESNMGLVTGVNLILHPNITQRLTAMRMTSPDGVSHSFDSRANGYGRGEAVGALVVKRLADALEDGDTIRAVIRGSGANQDGHTPGITMPSAEAQAQLIRTTYERAGLEFNDTAYFEAHGTGTAIGDPIELSAVGATFGQPGLDRRMPLYVGSVKANIGHTEGCAGLAGVFKAVLCLEKGVICPTPGIEKFNSRLNLADWNIDIPVENTPWPSGGPRRASVQSFGFGGSNAHVLLEDAASYLSHHGLKGNHTTSYGGGIDSDSGVSTSGDVPGPQAGSRPRLLVFSSRDQSGLERLSKAYHQHFYDNEVCDDDLDCLAYTLWKKRSHLDHRSFTITDSATSLRSVLAKGLTKVGRTVKRHEVAYVFTGQGAQWAGMGREMLKNAIFASSVQKSQTYLDRLGCSWNAAEEFMRSSDDHINEAQFSQPLCTILQIGLVDVLSYWGIRPSATVGHSSGEIGAAYAAHLLSHDDAVKIAYYRGIFSADVKNRVSGRKGAMMAAGISEEQARRYIQDVPKGSVVVACINSPSSVTLSGDAHFVEELTRSITNDGHFARLLKVATAYHSPQMRTISDDYLKAQGAIKSPPTTVSSPVAFFSSVTGRHMPPEQPLDESYWVQNLCSPVRFSEAVQSLLKFTKPQEHTRPRPVNWTTVIEIGPHSALKGPLRQIMSHTDERLESKIAYHSLLTRGDNSETACMSTAGRLWATGVPIDIARVNERSDIKPSSRCLNNLPTYPWNHQTSFWHEALEIAAERSQARPRSDLLGSQEQKFDPLHPRWRNFIRIVENPWIADHVITGSVLYPAAGMLVMAMEACAELCAAEDELDSFILEDVHFEKGLLLTSHDEAVETRLSLQSQPSKRASKYKFSLSSLTAGLSWTQHCYGTISTVCKQPKRGVSTSEGDLFQQNDARLEFRRIKEASAKHVDPDQFYQNLQDIGMAYGPLFANVTEAAAVDGEREGWGVIQTPNTKDSMPHQFEYPCFIHPATLDAIFHLLFVAFTQGGPLLEAAVPVTLEKMQISAKLPVGAGVKFVGYSKAVDASSREDKGDLVVWAEDTDESIVVRNFAIRQVSWETSISTTEPTGNSGVAKRCGVLEWNIDLDSLLNAPRFGSHASISGDGAPSDVNAELSQIIEAACHKVAQLRILVCGFSPEDVEYFLHCQSSNSSQTRRAAKWTVAGMNEAGERGVRDALSKVLGSNNQQHVTFDSVASAAQGTFDLVLGKATSPDASDMINSLSESKSTLSNIGHMLVVHQSGSLEKLPDADLRPLASCKGDLTIALASAHTAVKSTVPRTDRVLLLRPDSCSERISKFEAALQEQLRALGREVRIVTTRDVAECRNAIVISMLELEQPFSMAWTCDQLDTFKDLVSVAKHILWITRGGIENSSDSLNFSGTTGLLRTIRTEASTLSMPQLSLSNSADITCGDIVNLVRLVFELSLQHNSESEWAEANGQLRIPRVVEHDSFDRELNIHHSTPQAILTPMDTSLPMMLSARDGNVWVKDDTCSGQLASQALEIKVEAAYYMPAAAAEKSGLSEAHTISVGTTAQVGSAVEHLMVDDRVAVLGTRGYRTFIRSPSSLVHRIPAGIGNLDVSRKLFHYLTASYCFTSLAPVHTGTSVLVHHAGTSFGRAAISVALHHGARVMATVRTLEEKQTLLRRAGPRLAEEDVFDAEDRYVSDAIMRATNRLGVDTICGELSDDDLSVYGACVAGLGHIVNTNTGLCGAHIPAEMFRRGASITNVDMRRILGLESVVLRKCVTRAFEVILRSGTLQDEPPPRMYTPTDLSLANPGEGFVLSLESGALVPMLPEPAEELRLDPTGTYVLAGGLGALGFHLAFTMIEHGARHVVFLSRTPEGDRRQKVDSLRALNCQVDVVKCDVVDAGDVQNFVDECLRKQWRVRGVVQGAMVLRDSIFENMDLERWNEATRPKILGSWNLHRYLPRDMDFFILLSSIVSIIGNTAQGNYAAGNAYQDALAHFRRSQGLAAVSLNVGLVSDATHFDDAYSISDYLKTYGHMAGVLINSKELDVVLLAAMRGRTADGVDVPPQLIAGINANLQRSGNTLNTWMKDRKFDHRVVQVLEEGGAEQEDGVKQSLLSADSLEKAAMVVEQALRQSLATAMTASPDDIDVDLPIFALGVDSLKAVELRNWIRREMEAEVSVFEILRDQPLSKLSYLLAQKSALVSLEPAAQGL